ncbi:MAG TPA: hypothetical protein VIV58_05915 [Kofleriaceae bacterium]
MRRCVAAIVAAFLQACVSSRAPTPTVDTKAHDDELVRTVVGLAQDMAKNATEMHPERNAALIPDTDKVVYVSFGYPMTGREYLPTLRESYAKRRSLSHHWDRWEVTPLGHDAAVFTGWATMTEVSLDGETKTQHVIFTEVFEKTDAGWKRVIAQKSPLDEGE